MMGSGWAVADMSPLRIGSVTSSQDRGRGFKSLHLHQYSLRKRDSTVYMLKGARLV